MKIALITCGGTGIGRAITHRFAAEGCHVHIVGRRQEKLEEAIAGLASASWSAVDVAADGAMDAVVKELVDAHGGLDYLVASAGINPQRKTLTETDDEHWFETIRVNLTGMHRTCKAVVPAMQKRGEGAIVTIGSISGQVGMPERGAYGPTKAGVIQYTRNLAIDYAADKIRANCICPGFVITDLVTAWIASRTEEQMKKLVDGHPLGVGQPEDVAGAAWFLCSDDSRWITGVDLSVDGGFTCW
ncbi:MAG: SDR family oxidoreductase [Planctomycetes bacterium]|nr:SDR family oxidoreductase [Planctomycetota bacterium]